MSDSSPKDRKVELAEEILGLTFVSPGFLLQSMFIFSKLIFDFIQTEKGKKTDIQKIDEIRISASSLTIEQDQRIIKMLADNFTEQELEELLTAIQNPLILRFFMLTGFSGEIATLISSSLLELIDFIKEKIEALPDSLPDPSKMN